MGISVSLLIGDILTKWLQVHSGIQFYSAIMPVIVNPTPHGFNNKYTFF